MQSRTTGSLSLRSSDLAAELAAGLLLATALLFGGGSRGTGDLIVHLAALPALALGLLRWRHAEAGRLQRLFAWWLLAAIVVVALQLLPVPASLFAASAPRAAVLADLHQAGLHPAWLPMTLDVWGSVRAVLALATFGAAWLLVVSLPGEARIRLLQLALFLAVAMALLGFAQAAAGEHSRLRFYAYHHPIGAIGTFANRNHFADLMAMLVPMALAFAFAAQRERRVPQAIVWSGTAVVLFLSAALSFSRMGIVLTAMVTVIAFVVIASRIEAPGRAKWHLLPIATVAVAALGVAVYAWDGIAHRLAQDPLADLRWQYLRYGTEAVKAWLPWGSGAGTFRDVYAPFEPVLAMQQVHALHAHNDLLEVALEAGIPGLVLVAAFLWLLWHAACMQFRKRTDDRGRSSTIMPAAAIAVFVPLIHSFVDYPLRALSVAIVFATLVAVLMARPATARMT
ncbi:O-antigen ligase [Lysobacter niabensis]|uniref:O-antigen ligase n=1 Tax=Agrilutibacter niabensis TaxID=380628 RepID=A0ABU1VLD9_9GAMM|nr:O-antigen ligase family protein [Lysobacter niabensis]MDR7098298.1 O-antigen ligase [Lysobacter niabensis]